MNHKLYETIDLTIPKDLNLFKGLEQIWKLFFMISSKEITSFLSLLYSKSKEKSNLVSFFKICMEHLNNINSLYLMNNTMSLIEVDIDKTDEINEFRDENDFSIITLNGDAMEL